MRLTRIMLAAAAAFALLLAAEPIPLAAEETGEGNAYVGSEACYDCHAAADLGMEFNVHLRVRSFEVGGRETGCEGCHGPGRLHAESGDPELIGGAGESYEAGDEICMGCHAYKGRATESLWEWKASVHALEEVGCRSCHSVHQASEPQEACRTCHAEQVMQFQLPSRHPVREGKMDCSSCHNPHAAGEGMLKTRLRKADLCYSCHQAVEGPFIFEHPPVAEDCSLCHLPHGSVADNLLTANEPVLCLQCHDFHFHAGYQPPDDPVVEVGGFERENPFGAQGFNIAYTTSCTQCHTQIHGSDLPSQTVTGLGTALTH